MRKPADTDQSSVMRYAMFGLSTMPSTSVSVVFQFIAQLSSY